MKAKWISVIGENQCSYIDLSTFRQYRDRFVQLDPMGNERDANEDAMRWLQAQEWCNDQKVRLVTVFSGCDHKNVLFYAVECADQRHCTLFKLMYTEPEW